MVDMEWPKWKMEPNYRITRTELFTIESSAAGHMVSNIARKLKSIQVRVVYQIKKMLKACDNRN